MQSHVDVRPRAEIAALVLDPAEATVSVGAEQAYQVRTVDAHNADLGDVTDRAVLTTQAPGRCARRCTADRPADLEITAKLPGASGRATLHVVSEEPTVLMVDPAAPAAAAGTRQPFRVRGLDANRNDLGDVIEVSDAIDQGGPRCGMTVSRPRRCLGWQGLFLPTTYVKDVPCCGKRQSAPAQRVAARRPQIGTLWWLSLEG